MSNLPQPYQKYDLLFTPKLIPQLRNLRGEEWANLIDSLADLPDTHPDALAFAMTMIKLGGCLNCEMDSYRAQRGCATCAQQTIFSFKGSDQQLIKLFEQTRKSMQPQLAEYELKQAA